MAIKELTVTGFRSLKQVTWKPGRLNLLVGPNAGGKSNVLRCLELISNVARGRLEKTISESGGIVPLLWDHHVEECSWELRLDPPLVKSGMFKLDLLLEFGLVKLIRGSAYAISKDTLREIATTTDASRSSDYIFYRDLHSACVLERDSSATRPIQEFSANNLGGFFVNESLLSQQIAALQLLSTLVRHDLESWNIIHNLNAGAGSSMRKPATTQFTQWLATDTSNFVTLLHTLYTGNRDFRQRIDEGMRSGFGQEYERIEFQPAAAQQIQLAVQWKSSREPHAGSDLSDGTLRFLFLSSKSNDESLRIDMRTWPSLNDVVKRSR